MGRKIMVLFVAVLMLFTTVFTAAADDGEPVAEPDFAPELDIEPTLEESDLAGGESNDGPTLTKEEALNENLAMDISPEAAALESVKSEVLSKGHAYFACNSASGVKVYANTENVEEPAYVILNESVPFYADQVQNGMMHVWFANGNGTTLNGWVYASAGNILLTEGEVASFELATTQASVNGTSAILFKAEIKAEESKAEDKEEQEIDANLDIAPDPDEVINQQDDTSNGNHAKQEKEEKPAEDEPEVINQDADIDINPDVEGDVQLLPDTNTNNDSVKAEDTVVAEQPADAESEKATEQSDIEPDSELIPDPQEDADEDSEKELTPQEEANDDDKQSDAPADVDKEQDSDEDPAPGAEEDKNASEEDEKPSGEVTEEDKNQDEDESDPEEESEESKETEDATEQSETADGSEEAGSEGEEKEEASEEDTEDTDAEEEETQEEVDIDLEPELDGEIKEGTFVLLKAGTQLYNCWCEPEHILLEDTIVYLETIDTEDGGNTCLYRCWSDSVEQNRIYSWGIVTYEDLNPTFESDYSPLRHD